MNAFSASAMTDQLPGRRGVYRIEGSIFRVWLDEPSASAEIYNNGEWMYTIIPSGTIVAHPGSTPLSQEELIELGEVEPRRDPEHGSDA